VRAITDPDELGGNAYGAGFTGLLLPTDRPLQDVISREFSADFSDGLLRVLVFPRARASKHAQPLDSCQSHEDLVCDSIGEVLVLRVAEVFKWQDGKARPGRQTLSNAFFRGQMRATSARQQHKAGPAYNQ